MNRHQRTVERWLVADIGATSARCGILSPAARAAAGIRVFRNAEFETPEALLATYVSGLDEPPTAASLAVAAPVHGDGIRMLNRDWRFDRETLLETLAIGQLRIVNDFHAIAYALPTIEAGARCEIGKACEYRGGNCAALGPGSGLGMSAWIADDAGGAAMTGEGGHITLAGRNRVEDDIIDAVRERFGHASAERLLSGPGLIALHDIMHGIAVERSESITDNPGDARCTATMNQFFGFLASAAADLALITGCFGGLYIAGGIVPACLDQVRASPFRERFEDKNRYREYMRRIPTYVITDPYPGLSGLAAMLGRAQPRD